MWRVFLLTNTLYPQELRWKNRNRSCLILSWHKIDFNSASSRRFVTDECCEIQDRFQDRRWRQSSKLPRKVADYACGALNNLAWGHEDNKIVINARGGVKKIIELMNRHILMTHVQESGCAALGTAHAGPGPGGHRHDFERGDQEPARQRRPLQHGEECIRGACLYPGQRSPG